KERVPSELLSASASVPKRAILARLTKRLHDNLGLDEGFGRWEVESWALALGTISSAELAPTLEKRSVSGGPQRPQVSLRIPPPLPVSKPHQAVASAVPSRAVRAHQLAPSAASRHSQPAATAVNQTVH